MILNKLLLKTSIISLLVTLDVMANQFYFRFDPETGYSIQYLSPSSSHKALQKEERKTIYRPPFKKDQRFAKNNAKSAEIYQELQGIEAKVRYPTTNDVSQYNETLIKQVRYGWKIQRQISGLNFQDIGFNEVVGNMISILQTKLDCIGDIYQPQWIQNIENSEDEETADPYYANICMDYKNKNYYHFTLNYSGQSESAKQPGNSVIRQSVPWGKKNRMSYSINYSKEDYFNFMQNNEDLKDLLLALEVARRKVTDKGVNLKDEYYDLPLYSASMMAIELVNANKIAESDFWIKGGKYHMYSGTKTDREEGIKNIINRYVEVYKINNPQQLNKLILGSSF